MEEKVKIVEVGPRDGLQNESLSLSVNERVEFIQKLIQAGVVFLEGGSFVSPNAIPQMAQSDEVWKKLQKEKADISFLVPNQRGFEQALSAGIKSIAVFTATSETFNQKNIGKTVRESLDSYREILKTAKERKMRVRGYISTVFGCPYEGKQDIQKTLDITKELFSMGCAEVSIGDTIGVAHPQQVEKFFEALAKNFELQKIAAHLHDTRGMALANILTALRVGVRIFDSSIGGLGGCPFAKGSSGNVATEEVVYLLEGLGYHTGLSIKELFIAAE